MKKIIFTMMITTILLLLCGSLNAFALTEGDWEFQLLDNEVMITGYLGEGGEVVIPETIYGTKVTGIKRDTFSKTRDKMIKITFPKSIKEIPYYLFDYACNLEEVVMPEGVEIIGQSAFRHCCKLTELVLPSTIKSVGGSAFSMTAIESLILPEGVEYLGVGAFSATNISNLYFPNIFEFERSIFSDCKNLTSVVVADGVKEIKANMFSGCSSLRNVVLPNTIEMLGEGAFAETAIGTIILPTSLKKISTAFYNCDKLQEVVIPYGVTIIYENAFGRCDNLRSLYVPDSVEDFKCSYAFGNPISASSNCIIYCGENSITAEECKENQISYLTDNSVNSGITVLYNGTRISFHAYGQNPELLNSRTLVPLRSIFEAMGADVEWDDSTSTAIAKRDGVEVKIQIGANEMYKDGKAVPVDVPAMLLNDRTMVPVRVIAEAFGADVEWNGNGRTVLITE